MSPTNSDQAATDSTGATSAATASAPSTSREIGTTGVVIRSLGIDGSIFGWAAGVDETAQVLDRFRELGGNFVSTADHYAGGRSEVMIGSWLRQARARQDVIVATKVGRHPDAAGLGAAAITRGVEASLERLSTDYVDFLSFDGDDPTVPIEESLETVDRLVKEGKVRFLSAAGYTESRMRAIQAVAQASGHSSFRAIITEYNLMERDTYESGLQALAVADGRSAIARLPLADGYLSGMFRSRDDIPDSVMYGGAMRHIGRHGTRVLEALDSVAAEIGGTPTGVALAWVLLKPGIAGAVLRVKDVDQLEYAFAAENLRLTRHQVAALERASDHT